MIINLGNVATTEVAAFKSIEVGEDGKIIAVFYIKNCCNGGTVPFVIHDGTKPLGGPILIEAQHNSLDDANFCQC